MTLNLPDDYEASTSGGARGRSASPNGMVDANKGLDDSLFGDDKAWAKQRTVAAAFSSSRGGEVGTSIQQKPFVSTAMAAHQMTDGSTLGGGQSGMDSVRSYVSPALMNHSAPSFGGGPGATRHFSLASNDSGVGGNSGGGSPSNVDGGALSTIGSSNRTAWKCTRCSYFMMAMDHQGNALPLELDAFGKPIPLSCPRCEEEHPEWEEIDPKSQFGDYPNIPGGFGGRVTHGQSAPLDTMAKLAMPESLRKIVDADPNSHAAAFSPKRKVTMAFYCKRCDRRLMRIDSFGQLVPMETDPYGDIIPVYCPGCREEHSEWVQGAMNRGLKDKMSENQQKK